MNKWFLILIVLVFYVSGLISFLWSEFKCQFETSKVCIYFCLNSFYKRNEIIKRQLKNHSVKFSLYLSSIHLYLHPFQPDTSFCIQILLYMYIYFLISFNCLRSVQNLIRKWRDSKECYIVEKFYAIIHKDKTVSCNWTNTEWQ